MYIRSMLLKTLSMISQFWINIGLVRPSAMHPGFYIHDSDNITQKLPRNFDYISTARNGSVFSLLPLTPTKKQACTQWQTVRIKILEIFRYKFLEIIKYKTYKIFGLDIPTREISGTSTLVTHSFISLPRLWTGNDRQKRLSLM